MFVQVGRPDAAGGGTNGVPALPDCDILRAVRESLMPLCRPEPESTMREALRDTNAWPLLASVTLGGILVYLLQPILTPFLVGMLFAYLGDPIADRLEALGLGRSTSVTLVFVGLTLLLAGVVLLLVPILGGQIDALIKQLPALLDWLQNQALPWVERTLDISVSRIDLQAVRQAVTAHWESTGTVAGAVLSRVTTSSLALLGLLTNLALIPVVTFYLLRDFDVLVARIKGLLPRRVEPTVSLLAKECDEVVAAFLRGQLLVMLALGIIYSAGLWLVGLKLGIIIGLVAGLVNIVPYLGFIIGIGAASLAAVVQFDQPWTALALVWLVFMIGQTLEGTILTPLLVGDRIGLHPVAVIFAVLAGGQLFGFVGVLLGLPVAAVIMVLLRHAHDRYMASSLYETRAARGREGGQPPTPDDD